MLVDLATIEMKAFVPARDLAKSTAFYVALGFEVPWSSDDLAYVRYGSTRMASPQRRTKQAMAMPNYSLKR